MSFTPITRYTKLMTISLAEYGNYWSNAFPSNTGVLKTLSPSNVIEGKRKPDFNYQQISFGSYALVYVGTKNNLKARSVPAIPLKLLNDWGGFFFMSLMTGKKLHAFKWVELPINDEVIEQVNILDQNENQPIISNGTVVIEWGSHSADNVDNIPIDNNIDDNLGDHGVHFVNEMEPENMPSLAGLSHDVTEVQEDYEDNTDEDIILNDIELQMNNAMIAVNEEQDSTILDEDNNVESEMNEDN